MRVQRLDLVDAGRCRTSGTSSSRARRSTALGILLRARLAVSTAIGGCRRTCRPTSWTQPALLEIIPPFIEDVEKTDRQEPHLADRTVGIAALSGRRRSTGLDRPCLRASGVAYDVRRAHPYDLYDTVDWSPGALRRRVYDRYRIRMLGDRQFESSASCSIAACRRPLHHRHPHVACPPKEAATQMEAMIYHFKLIMDRSSGPGRRVYSMVEGANGESFYTSATGARGLSVKVRLPLFPIFSAFSRLINAGSLSDAIVCCAA